MQQNASVHHFLEDQGGTVSQNTKETTGVIWRKANTKGVLTPPHQGHRGGIGPSQLVTMMIKRNMNINQTGVDRDKPSNLGFGL